MAKSTNGRHIERSLPEAVVAFRRALEQGDDWFDALLEAVRLWEAPEEVVDGREYTYLIGGEAFDWLLLAERLLEHANGSVAEHERDALLFAGRTPRPMDDLDFKRAIGDAKYRAHLNFIYGVRVEEALQLTVEQEVIKERLSCVWMQRDSLEHQVFERVYGRGRDELLAEYRSQTALPAGDAMSYRQHLGFTYWLSKYRMQQLDPARVASDTRKALVQLSAMEAAARRRARHLSSSEDGPVAVVEGEVVAHLR